MNKIVGIGLICSLLTFSFSGAANAESKTTPNKIELKQMNVIDNPNVNLLKSIDLKGINKGNNSNPVNQKAIQSNSDSDIRYEDEPNDYFDSANVHNMKYYISGTIEYEDIDLFQITVSKSGKYVLVGTTSDDNLMDLGMGIYDEYENILQPEDGEDTGKTKARGYYLTKGTYYIAVVDLNDYGIGEDYLLKLSPVNSEDKTAPSRPKVNQIDDNDTRVIGTAEANAQIWVQAGDNWISTSGYADSKGKFSIKIPKQKTDTFIAVCAVDEAGNQGKFAEQWVIDKTAPPTLTVKTITAKTVYVTGKTEAKAKVQVKRGKTSLGTATADKKGNYKVKIAKQKKGKKLTIIARDSAKNAKTIYTTVK